ncbi:hypothetical protein JBL43_00780 [Aureibaculum sp. A20]|uniref:EF-hand domain-containing protein n=1 Tax=Aureibaculum flavum TaxID=2795986 RepID=A0ABS0WLA3_9FLAO|nr:hypothetical protein [Aureibaculum flavum]MBJ2172750.1 hypothetical protein [Aureibaculum flavum]
MKINLSFLIAISSILFLTNCKSTKDIAILQNKKKVSIKKNAQIVSIAKSPFSFYFKMNKYTKNSPVVAKLAAFSNKTDLDALKVGLNVSQTECFAFGDALALRPVSGYDALFILDYGYHALYYENSLEKSVEFVSEKDDFTNVAFHINQLFTGGEYIPFEAYQLSEIYIALFIDANTNNIIDEDELTKFTLQFKTN